MMKNKEIWYKNFVYMQDDKIVKFEATKGTHIFDAVESVILFLRYRNIDGEYDLMFNDKCLKLNKLSITNDIVSEFFGNNEQVL